MLANLLAIPVAATAAAAAAFRAKQLWQAWHRMGLQHICMLGATPRQQQPATCSACPPASSSGNYKAACICSWCSAPCRAGDGVWQVVEGLMCPGALRLSLHDALGYLPWLLLRWCQQLCFALLHMCGLRSQRQCCSSTASG